MKIKVIIFLIFLLFWILVFGGLNLIITKVLVYDINKRYLHIRLIIAGFLAALITAGTGFFSNILLLVDWLINLPFVGNLLNAVLPSRSYELIYIVLCSLGLNLFYTVLMIAVFIITRIIFSKKDKYIDYQYCSGAERIIHSSWFIVNKYYDDDSDQPKLSGKGFSLGIIVKGAKWVFAGLWILELAVLYWSILWGGEQWNTTVLSISKSIYLLPMVAFILLEQIQLFLEGPETTEVGTFGTVDISEAMIGRMGPLMERFREAFAGSGMLLYSERGTKRVIDRQGLESNDLGNQQIADCHQPGILTVISNQIRESGVHQNISYQNALVSLLNGDSVNIRDSVDGEFNLFLCAYLNYFISLGSSAIIVCPGRQEISKIKNILEDCRSNLKCIDRLWNIKEVSELNPQNHIGVLVCTCEELLSLDFSNTYEYLAADMFCAVVVNSSSIMSIDSIRRETVFSRLKALPNLKQYIFISDEDNESLRADIKQYLPEGVKITSFSNDMRVPQTNIMIWKEESVYKPQRALGIGTQSSPYLGTALPLALIGAKYDLSQVNVVPGEGRGDVYYFGSARQSNEGDIQLYIGKNLNLNSIIRYSSTEAMRPMELKMLVVYDNDSNIFNALWKWFKYAGKEETLIHVVSPFYMMREYFAANIRRKSLLYSNNEISALLPDDTVLKRSLLAVILASLVDSSMTEDELMGISSKYGWDYPDVVALLQDAILTVRADREFHNVYEQFRMKEDPALFEGSEAGFVRRIRIKLADPNLIAQQKTQISLAKMSYKTNEFIQLPILSGNIWNYYQPKQIMAFEGSYYMVNTIDSDKGIIYTKPFNPTSVPDYYPVCDYTISNYTVLDNCVDSPILDCDICEASASKTIYGYISSNNGNDFSKDSKPVINRINDSSNEYVKTVMDRIPVLTVSIPYDSFSAYGDPQQAAKKSIMLLSVILNGMFRTLFPKTYQNIAAVPDFPIDDELIERVMHSSSDCSEEDLVRASIPRIKASEEAKDSRFIRLYILEYSRIEYGMVKSFYDNIEKIFNAVYEYLDWYTASNRKPEGSEETAPQIIRGSYLHYGLDAIPDMFATEPLLSVLRDILGRTDTEGDIEADTEEAAAGEKEATAVCSFCGREVIFGWKLSDGRIMCNHCHDHQKTQKDEIKKLFIETRTMLEAHYHITIRKDINVRFQSAEAIRKVAGGTAGNRTVGFYNHRNRQLWIEARGPSIAMESTIAHELTHAWQYDELPLKEMMKKFPKPVREKRKDLLLEGHAVYVEIEAMREKGEAEYAKRISETYLKGDDMYSKGYRLVSDYFESMEIDRDSSTAFVKMKKMVEDIIKGEASIIWPEGY